MAKLFHQQCCGSHNGSMAHIPNVPILFGITGAHSSRMTDRESMPPKEFAEFLKGVIEHLDVELEF